eukprot:TRINITY_DN45321_c0_g1_i1.p1 TRINITY_DN45321_c0_g1~~TRINITY_DN45321_c0_g1_i1.p1  ORF type:complete len:476 (+),score=73.01 TRINITY_DN45321_c0_g1_i1:65-1492(+)
MLGFACGSRTGMNMFGGGLRFKVGNEVLCRTSPTEWSLGKVVSLNYRERNWPPDRFAPYQVELLDGSLIFVPADVPKLCKSYEPPPWLQSVDDMDLHGLKAAVSKTCEDEDHLGRSALLACLEKGWQEGADLLLAQGADPNKSVGAEKNTALHLAVMPLKRLEFQDFDKDTVTFSRDDDVVSAKRKKRGSPDDDIYDESLLCISYDDKDGKITWIERDDPDSVSSSVLPTSMRSWVPARLASICQGTAVKLQGLPELACKGNLVRNLLEARANVNAQNEDPDQDLDNFSSATFVGIEQREHRSALHYVAEANDAATCMQLIDARATVDLMDCSKMTPLDAALEAGSLQAVELLLMRSADPNRGNVRRGLQQSALHQSTNLGNLEAIRLLVEHKADVNAAGKQGMTPLHFAARKKSVEAARVLLAAGADVTLRDKSGLTAEKLAIKNGSKALAAALADGLQLSDRVSMLDTAISGA